MIKIEANKCGIKASIKGSLNDLMAESILIVRNVWESIKAQNEDAADEFAFMVSKAFTDGIAFCEDEEIGKKCLESGFYIQACPIPQLYN